MADQRPDPDIAEIEQQEAELQLSSFSNQDAFDIGTSMVERARAQGNSIVVDIERNGRCLFHHAMEATSGDHDKWVQRKKNTVNLVGQSTMLVRLQLEKNGLNMSSRYLVDGHEYVASGGGFPIRVKNTGAVGTIVVSGLPDTEDHALIVWALRKHLAAAGALPATAGSHGSG